MSRSSSNWMAIEVEPSELVVEMVSMPAIVANCLISGVATDVAMVSAEAPGSCAETLIDREFGARQGGDRQEPVGEQAADHQRHRHQQRRDRPADAEFGDRHRAIPLSALPGLSRRGRRRHDGHARLQPLLAFRDDAVAGRQAGAYRRHVAVAPRNAGPAASRSCCPA